MNWNKLLQKEFYWLTENDTNVSQPERYRWLEHLFFSIRQLVGTNPAQQNETKETPKLKNKPKTVEIDW